jgi:hypothetical protein
MAFKMSDNAQRSYPENSKILKILIQTKEDKSNYLTTQPPHLQFR